MEGDNPLLSEFGRSALSRYLASGSWGRHVAYFLIFGVLIVLWLGHQAHCNAIEIRFTGELLELGAPFEIHGSLIYGYLNELSHAFFYLTLAPTFAIIACKFIRSEALAFDRLIRRGVLVSASSDPVHRLRQWNRLSFVLVTVPLATGLFVFNVRNEIEGYKLDNLGYIQAPFLQCWVNRFDGTLPYKTLPYKRFKYISDKRIETDLASEANKCLTGLTSIPDAWLPVISLPRFGPSRPEEVKAFHDPASRGPVEVDLEAACARQLVALTATQNGGPDTFSSSHGWWRLFVFALLVYEGLFHAFCIWIAIKILCTLVFLGSILKRPRRKHTPAQRAESIRLLVSAHLNILFQSIMWKVFAAVLPILVGLLVAFDMHRTIEVIIVAALYPLSVLFLLLVGVETHEARIEPLLTDPTKRFGLEEFHQVYNYVALLLLMGGIGASLNFTSNVVKGSEFLAGGHSVVYSAQLLIMVAVLLVATGILVGPVLIFAWLLRGYKIDRFSALDAQMERSGADYATIVQEKELISQQTTWPRDDTRFKQVATFVLVFLVLPWASSLGILPDSISEASNVIALARSTTQRISHFIYRVPAD